MQDRIEIILRFRRSISARYVVYGIVVSLIVCISIVLHFLLLNSIWLKSILSGLTWVGIGFLWYLFYHRQQILWHLNVLHFDAVERLENYFQEKQKRWFDVYLIRMGGMSSLALLMLLLLFFYKESIWSGVVTGLFIALLLLFLFKGWLDFNDELFLQDIKHTIRDQTSE